MQGFGRGERTEWPGRGSEEERIRLLLVPGSSRSVQTEQTKTRPKVWRGSCWEQERKNPQPPTALQHK